MKNENNRGNEKIVNPGNQQGMDPQRKDRGNFDPDTQNPRKNQMTHQDEDENFEKKNKDQRDPGNYKQRD